MMAAIEFAAVNDDAIRSASDKVSVAADDSWALFAAYRTISALLFVHKNQVSFRRGLMAASQREASTFFKASFFLGVCRICAVIPEPTAMSQFSQFVATKNHPPLVCESNLLRPGQWLKP